MRIFWWSITIWKKTTLLRHFIINLLVILLIEISPTFFILKSLNVFSNIIVYWIKIRLLCIWISDQLIIRGLYKNVIVQIWIEYIIHTAHLTLFILAIFKQSKFILIFWLIIIMVILWMLQFLNLVSIFLVLCLWIQFNRLFIFIVNMMSNVKFIERLYFFASVIF